ncbi:MAG: SUMF1/EgtB/PvdO family nonheme iron enzyme [Alphaproteobacteria bacterium]|nr:SUMF1/EgtB/PvdO family nonheme iron enzyme [Alphaproteobacteria bacterium]
MPDVFLSYNREDQAKAKLIAEALEADGISVWWDTVLRAGETYDEVTERHLREAKAVVVLWSQRSVKSKWVRAEATLGERKSALVPAMIEPCERPILFELIQTADLSHWSGDHKDPHWLDFLEDVRARIGGAAAVAPAPAPAVRAEEPSESLEAAFWTSVQSSSDPADFESYLKRFPSGHFADLARRRLDALRKPAAPQLVAATPAPDPVAAAPRPRRKAEKSGGSPMPLILGAAALAAAAFGAYVFMSGDNPPTPPAPAAVQADAAPAAAEPSETAQAPQASAPQATAQPAAPQGAVFQDCSDCPIMVRLTGGSFQMGSPDNERGRNPWEGPRHSVQIQAFAMAASEVTFAQWDACVADGGCRGYTPGDRGWGRGDRPALSVSWDDAQAYVQWLSRKSGRAYRLPSESEWEYAARAGSDTAFPWGASYDRSRAITGQTQPFDRVWANPFGLHAMGGNLREWVEDCYVNSYTGAPADGRPVTSGNCAQRVVRDASWRSGPNEFRSANRARVSRNVRDSTIGFRVAAAS